MKLMISSRYTTQYQQKNCLIHTRIMADQIQCIDSIINCDNSSVTQI